MFIHNHRARTVLFLAPILALLLVTACTGDSVVGIESYVDPLQAVGRRGFNPPSDLLAAAATPCQSVTSCQIDLSWADNSTAEDGFRVERSHDGSVFYQIASVARDVTTYSDMGLTASTTYHYRVRAYKTKKNGTFQYTAYSNIAAATTPSVGPTGSTADLPTLRPESPDGTNDGVTCVTTCWSRIDDDPDFRDGIVIYGEDGTSAFINFTAMPLDFVSMASLSAKVYVFYPYAPKDDDSEVFLQIFDADEATPLTDEVSLGSVQSLSYQPYTVNFSIVSPSVKAIWDAARMRLRFTYTRVRSPEVNHLYVDAIELTGTYNPSGG